MLFVCVARSLEDYFELIDINIDAFLGMFFKEITVNERNRFIKEFKVQSIRNEDDKLEEHRTGVPFKLFVMKQSNNSSDCLSYGRFRV